MDPNERIELASELLYLGSTIEDREISRYERGIAWGRGVEAIMLPDEAARQFLALAGRLAQQRYWRDQVSEDYLSERLVPILITARSGDIDQVVSEIDDLINEIESRSVERTVYVPLNGVLLEIPELQIGRVALRVIDDEELDTIRQTLEGSRASAPESTVRLPPDVSKNLSGKVCAVYSSLAEPTRARELAEVETRRALELLVFGNAALYPFHPRSDAVVGLDGEVPHLGPWIGVFGEDGFNFSIRTVPTSWPIEVTPTEIEALDKVGVFALSDLLALPKEGLTELEDALLRAVHWFAASQAQVELENRLLNLMTSLEVLVGPEDNSSIAATVSTRTALIVAHADEHREGVRKFVRDLYRARSGVSHGGSKVVAEGDVKELRRIAAELIVTLIRFRDRIRTKEELRAWLDQLTGSQVRARPIPPDGTPKTLREWREARNWSPDELADETGKYWIDADLIDCWEQSRPAPDAADLRRLANALRIQPEEIDLPQHQDWVVVRGHRFHLTARREEYGKWVAKIAGWDHGDAVEWPVRAVDPDYPDNDSPYIMTTWRETGLVATRALRQLSDRIVAAMERALYRERLPDDPPDWQLPDTD